MDKGKLEAKITSSFKTLQLDSAPKILLPSSSYRPPLERARCRSLLSLCIGVLGKHFEDITAELNEIAVNFPPDIKMAMLGVARRRNLLNDDVLIALAEKSWDILDISGSEVSDFGLVKVAELCHHLRAIDISRCCNVTALGVSNLLDHCHSLEVLRWGLPVHIPLWVDDLFISVLAEEDPNLHIELPSLSANDMSANNTCKSPKDRDDDVSKADSNFEKPSRSISKVSNSLGLNETPASRPMSHKSSLGHGIADGADLCNFLHEVGRSRDLTPATTEGLFRNRKRRTRAVRRRAARSPSAESTSSLGREKLIGDEYGELLQVGHNYASFTGSFGCFTLPSESSAQAKEMVLGSKMPSPPGRDRRDLFARNAVSHSHL
ncbi:hypothetical protein MRB53_026380 [Persea americana]|uniref:Uncharacterized protein n=1 Tax=Persea americana TaxID=3435 RepID=A0ACC2LJ38_PERAE|nr:hypothetical protein MRB53_026380 [Persea americana]